MKEKSSKKLFFKKPIFALVMLGLAAVLFILWKVSPTRNYGDFKNAYFLAPIAVVNSEDGRIAVNDLGERIYVFDEEEQLEYVITPEQIKEYTNISFSDIEFGPDGQLYVVLYEMEENTNNMLGEAIVEFDREGHYVDEMGWFDYSEEENPPKGEQRIYAMQYYDDALQFVYNAEGKLTLYALDPSRHVITEKAVFQRVDGAFASDIRSDYKGNYCINFSNGEIGKLSTEGAYEFLYKEEFSLYDNPTGFYPYGAAFYGDDVLAPSGIRMAEVKYLEDGVPQDYLTIYDFCGDLIEADALEEHSIQYYYSITSAYSLRNDGAAILAYDNVYFMTEDGFVPMENYYELPLSYTITEWASFYLWIPALVFLALGIVSGIGCLMRWRLGIISKQLLLNLPIVAVCVVVMFLLINKNVKETYLEEIQKEMFAVSELAMMQLDVEEIEQMRTSACAEDGRAENLYQQLQRIVGYNKRSWSGMLEADLYLCNTPEVFSMLSNSIYHAQPFMGAYLQVDESGEFIEKEGIYDEATGAFITTAYTSTSELIVVDTYLYNADGERIALFELSSDCSYVNDQIKQMLLKTMRPMVVCVPILVVALILVSVVNARALKKASTAVSKIAGGDFSARVDYNSTDEVGAICKGVNDMASRLDEYFAQKDKNEKFYYKFVPEKFRELLHKDNFTDLALGDAESADLTVLFCDIRAFSLNSEMMTAKENFEFVNVIYGKAGPIIRNHNGFVDKYIGDAVMALFENADDAVAAGIELYHAVVLNPDTAKEMGVSSINIGIGIHSGMARVGIVGEDERLSGTVISNTVNISSRLESLTKTYNTAMLISKDTLDRMSDPDSMHMRYLGMVQVAGVNEVKALYEVLDCLDETRKNERLRTSKDFREAVRLFHLGQFDESMSYFKKVQNDSENDPALELYIATLQQKIDEGDMEHNVFRFTKK